MGFDSMKWGTMSLLMAAILFISDQHFCVLMSNFHGFDIHIIELSHQTEEITVFEKTVAEVSPHAVYKRSHFVSKCFNFSGSFSRCGLDSNSVSSLAINHTKNFVVLQSVTPLQNACHPLMSFRI